MNLTQFGDHYIGTGNTTKFWCVRGKNDHQWKILVIDRHNPTNLVNISLYLSRFLKLRLLEDGFLSANYGGGNPAGIAEHCQTLLN